MQQDSASARQLIVERIKQSTNILVTVSTNPSVDALSAALALTLLLNKLDKHATAVFSGTIPPAINFLEPGKTFENKVDSLRDFIIALDKDKADRLRYKVEDDVVRIFITPYRTTITQNDLQFSQGDFNVDLIIALGVEKREELDKAITAHGRILHDATIVTVNAANQKSSLGSVDWQDGNASSLCEMLIGISEALQTGLLDQQLSNALLTGIVAATARFSNQHTTPRVMTMAAQLIAAGANPQLIASNLRQADIIPAEAPQETANSSIRANQPPVVAEQKPDGEMHITHTDQQKPTPQAKPPAPLPEPAANNAEVLEPEIPIEAPAASKFKDLQNELERESIGKSKPNVDTSEPPTPGSVAINGVKEPAAAKSDEDESYLNNQPSWKGKKIMPPSLGGALSATAEEALADKQKSDRENVNKTILTHGASTPKAPSAQRPKGPKADYAPKPSLPEPKPAKPPQPTPILQPEVRQPEPSEPLASMQDSTSKNPTPAPLMDSISLQTEPTIEQLEQDVASSHTPKVPSQPEVDQLANARQAVDSALESQPLDPAFREASGAQPMLETPVPQPPVQQPASLPSAEPLPPLPPADPNLPMPPPLPDINTIPTLPPLPESPAEPASPAPPQQNPQPQDPGQFRIPGQ